MGVAVLVKVRIVDDSADMVDLLKTYIGIIRPDVEVDAVTDGFFRLLDNNAWDGIDIAVLDVMLANDGVHRVTGAGIAAWLAEHKPRIRRVIWTASIIGEDPDLELLADRVVRKGVPMAELGQAVFGG